MAAVQVPPPTCAAGQQLLRVDELISRPNERVRESRFTMDAGFQDALKPFLDPLPGETPCGQDERHSHPYLEADNETKKLGGLRQEPVDWERVLELSSELLKSSTKDLKLAGCRTLALYHLQGLHGLNQGLYIIVEWLDRYWDHVHPMPRSPSNFRRRASPLTWLNGHLQKIFTSLQPTEADAPALISIQSIAKRYKSICVDRFGKQTPAFEDLLTAIDRATEALDLPPEQHQAPAAPEPKEPEAPVSSSSHEPATVPAIETPESSSTNAEDNAQENPIPSDILALLAPISTEHPSGADERYHESFEQARGEAKKLDDQLANKTPDWELTLDLSRQLLETATKDLNLAAFITLAKYEFDGLRGLADGFLLVTELTEQFWDSIFPQPRNATNFKRRASPLSWLNKHVEKRLQAYEVRPTDGPDIARLEQVLKRYANTCNTKFEKVAPASRQLLESAHRLSIIHAELCVQEPEPAQAPVTPEPAQDTAPKASDTPAESAPPSPEPAPTPLETPSVQQAPTDLSQVSEYLGQVGETLSDLSRQLREAEPTNPLSYRLHRQAIWMHLTTAPPSNAEGKTSIPPLPDQVRQQLETLLTHQNWVHLLDEAESRLDKFRFSLDLHRYVVIALQGMGKAGEAVENVKAELHALLKRMPSLLELSFSNAAPLADAETKAWIQKEVLAGSGTQASMGETGDDAWWAEISTALESDEAETIVTTMQLALRQAPDQIQFVQRALQGATQIRSVPGLSLLLAHVAHQGIQAMGSAGRPVHNTLEASCLRLLLQLRSSNPTSGAPVVKDPGILPLAIELAQRDLADALPYFVG